MRKQFAIAIVAIMLLSALSTPLKAETLCSYSGPDLSEDLLRLTDFSVIAPSPLKEGDTITVKFNLQNFGQYDLNLGTRGIFAAATDPDNTDVSFGFSYASTTLKVGETLSVNVSRTLYKAGTWTVWPSYYLALATGEKFGPDKWHACPITVEAATLPDLVVEKIECGPGSKLSVTIKNIGSGSLPSGWMAVTEVYFDGIRKGFFDLKNPTSTIGGGIEKPRGSSTYLLAWDITVPVTVRVIVDHTNGIQESNEQNNSREEKVEPLITKLPDLIIDEIKCDRENSWIGYVVKNVGDGTAKAVHTATLYVADKEKSHDLVDVDLEPGATYESWFKEYKWLECHTIEVKVCADNYNQVNESNEQNNCLEKTCECVVDISPPVIISRPSVSEVTQTSAHICWKTDEASNSLVRYDNRAGKYGGVVEDSNLVKEHCLTLTKLEPATTYHFVVESSDSRGNKVRGRDLSFESISPPDEEKPSLALQLPDKLSGRVPISVDTQDDIGVDRVAFFIDGELAHTDYSPPFELILDTMDLDEGSHKFDVRSIDHAGNIVEVSRKSVVQNQFPVDLSPVHVQIITPEVIPPESRAEVYGEVPIGVEVTHDLDYGIKNITVEVDGVVICEKAYTKGYYMDVGPGLQPIWVLTGYPQPPVYETCVWDVGVEWGSTHVIEVSAQDKHGNWGHASMSVIIARPAVPAIPKPYVDISRNVKRHDNYFEVTLTIENIGDVDISDITIADTNLGFQAINYASTSIVAEGPFGLPQPYNVVNTREGRSSQLQYHYDTTLRAGHVLRLKYYVVPILFIPEESISHMIGYRLLISYRAGDDYYSQEIDHLRYTSSVEVDDAFRSADYLIVTNPSQLFDRNDDAAVNNLLSTMAELAKEKQGVFGYLPHESYDPMPIKNKLRAPGGAWGSKLPPSWQSSGYLLLVGEAPEIVPSFNWSKKTIRITDYPYSDIHGDEQPELKVGRIIGNTAEDLIKPIQASLDVHRGEADYDGSHALMISGPEDTWEDFVKDIETGNVTLSGKGVTIEVFHTDFFITDYQMLAKSLRILGSQGHGCEALDPPCAAPLPPGYELSRGAPFSKDDDEHNTTKQLAAWMLWAMYELPDSDKIQALNDASYADSLITNARLERALELAEDIRTIRVGRGGNNYGWSYRYKHSDWDTDYRHSDWICEQWRANGIKPLTPNKDLIVFNGHGDPGGWCAVLGEWSGIGCPIEPIDFGSSRPIVLAFACHTGDYTELDKELKPVSIARAFLRNDAGVYFGSTEEARCDHGSSMLTEKFWEYWSRSSRIGDTVFDLKTWMIQQDDENWDWTCYEFNLYGDPKFGGE